jgi:hypothetical protein
MTSFGRYVAELVVAAGLLVAVQAVAMTTSGSGSTVTTPETGVTVVDGVITSIDVKQGLLVAAGRTYRFDPANVSFSDDRRQPLAGGISSLKAGSKVTLRTVAEDGKEQLLQIIAHD